MKLLSRLFFAAALSTLLQAPLHAQNTADSTPTASASPVTANLTLTSQYI